MNKQLIIHIAAELLIIGTITVLFNKRVNKLETIITEYDKKYNSLFKKIEYLSEIISAQNSQIKLLTTKLNNPQLQQQQLQQNPQQLQQQQSQQNPQQQSQNKIQSEQLFKTNLFQQLQPNHQQLFQPNIVEVELPLNVSPIGGLQNIFNMMTQNQLNSVSGFTNNLNNNSPKVTVIDDEEETKLDDKDKAKAKANNIKTPFQTSIKLTSVEEEIIPIGTSYGWDHDGNCWIYNYNDTFYKADLHKDFDYCNIMEIWYHPKNVIFEVTYPELKKNFSNYCFVGKPSSDYWKYAFGIGFFLYKKNGGYDLRFKYIGSHVDGSDSFAIFYITQDNIDKITLNNDINEKIYNDSGRKFKTTIPLKLDNNTSLPVGTEYCWNHELNNKQGCWIYSDISNKRYYSAAFKA